MSFRCAVLISYLHRSSLVVIVIVVAYSSHRQ